MSICKQKKAEKHKQKTGIFSICHTFFKIFVIFNASERFNGHENIILDLVGEFTLVYNLFGSVYFDFLDFLFWPYEKSEGQNAMNSNVADPF